MHTIDDVKIFLNDFSQEEYNQHIKRNKLEGTRGSYIKDVSEFFNRTVFLTAKQSFNTLKAWPIRKDLGSRMNYINEILCKRKVFVIEQYKDTKYNTIITNEEVTSDLYMCYVSHYHKPANDCYFERFYITALNNKLKLIAVDSITRDKGWSEIAQLKNIIDIGVFVNAEKIQTPAKQEDLKHYNSI
jgi:hypothetical protein